MTPAQLTALTGGAAEVQDGSRPAASATTTARPDVEDSAPFRLTVDEVAQHADETDCWVIVDDQVYDVTEFLSDHPGGGAILAGVGGSNATMIFDSLHDRRILDEVAAPYHLGSVGDTLPKRPENHPTATKTSKGGDQTDSGETLDPKQLFGPEFPKAMRWLAARWQPEALPVSLRPLSSTPGETGGTGMNPLRPELWFELDHGPGQRDPTISRFVNELGIKKRLLDPSSPHYDTCFQALPDSDREQEELLQHVLEHLRCYHADQYVFGEDSVEVLATGDRYRISDFSGRRDHLGNPIAMLLATLLVQEEFYIMRREGRIKEFAVGDAEPYRYVFVAGTAAINLVVSGLKGQHNDFKLGSPMHAIHGRVPGMKEQGWHPKLAHTFSGITAEQGFWRTNWGAIPHNMNTHLLHDDGMYATEQDVADYYGENVESSSATDEKAMSAGEAIFNHWNRRFGVEGPQDMHVFAEYQCLNRLPRTMALVFSIHKYIDPISALAQTPEAADMMARAWAARGPEQLHYQGVRPDLIEYVRGVAECVL